MQILDVSPDQHGPGFRIHGSMKVVDQDTGDDLDPTGQIAAKAGPGVCMCVGCVGGGGGDGVCACVCVCVCGGVSVCREWLTLCSC
jgi:hypothetical protein